jgi:hypothetical protein
LAFACAAASRGHEVTLYEADGVIGGDFAFSVDSFQLTLSRAIQLGETCSRKRRIQRNVALLPSSSEWMSYLFNISVILFGIS